MTPDVAALAVTAIITAGRRSQARPWEDAVFPAAFLGGALALSSRLMDPAVARTLGWLILAAVVTKYGVMFLRRNFLPVRELPVDDFWPDAWSQEYGS